MKPTISQDQEGPQESKADWQPIDTAPRDGTRILLSDGTGDFPFIASWTHVGRFTTSPKMWLGHEYGAMNDAPYYKWMPLPKGPNQ